MGRKLWKEVKKCRKSIIALVVEAVDVGHAVVFGAVVAGRIARLEGVVYGAVVVGAGASKEMRPKDVGKAPQPAGASRCTFSHNFLTVFPFALLFTNVLEAEFTNVLEKLSEKSLRCVWNSLKRSPLIDFLAPYLPNAWLGALLKPLFGQFRNGSSRKFA